MPNPGMSPERMALESAYTEAEAAQEVVKAALACLEGRCVAGNSVYRNSHGCLDVSRAVRLWRTYKGVK
jgi:hypothetical protein